MKTSVTKEECAIEKNELADKPVRYMVPKITCRNYFESEGPAWQGLLRYIHLPIRSTNYNLTGKNTNNFQTTNNA